MLEDLTDRKQSHINALFSNSGYEGREGASARQEAIDRLERQYEEMVDVIYGDGKLEDEIDENDPFFAHAYDGLPPLEKQEDS